MKALTLPFRALINYLAGSYHEFRRVTWPTRAQVIQYTILVTATIIVVTAFLTAFDFGMQALVSKYLIR